MILDVRTIIRIAIGIYVWINFAKPIFTYTVEKLTFYICFYYLFEDEYINSKISSALHNVKGKENCELKIKYTARPSFN